MTKNISRPNKTKYVLCGSGYPTCPNFFTPYPKLFSPFWSNCSSEKETGRSAFERILFFDMNQTALRKAKTVYNFGLSECDRIKRKNICAFKGHKDHIFAIVSYFFICQKKVYAF